MKKFEPTDPKHDFSGLTWGQIGVIAGSFLAGIIGTLICQSLGVQTQQFDALGLIGFSLSILISGASIVLAISAISLGRASEDAMTQRSDESIRIQNDIFLKTTDALQRIESSTGVTEKRIEDIISGRVGDLSKHLAEVALSQRHSRNPAALEHAMKQSLLKELEETQVGRRSLEMKRQAEEEEKRKAEEEKTYRKLLESLHLSVANNKNLDVVKMGEGTLKGEGEKFFDVLAKNEFGGVGFCLFRGRSIGLIIDGDFITRAARELGDKRVGMIGILVDPTVDDGQDLDEIARALRSTMKDDYVDRIAIKRVSSDSVDEAVTEIAEMANKRMQPTATAVADA